MGWGRSVNRVGGGRWVSRVDRWVSWLWGNRQVISCTRRLGNCSSNRSWPLGNRNRSWPLGSRNCTIGVKVTGATGLETEEAELQGRRWQRRDWNCWDWSWLIGSSSVAGACGAERETEACGEAASLWRTYSAIGRAEELNLLLLINDQNLTQLRSHKDWMKKSCIYSVINDCLQMRVMDNRCDWWYF